MISQQQHDHARLRRLSRLLHPEPPSGPAILTCLLFFVGIGAGLALAELVKGH